MNAYLDFALAGRRNFKLLDLKDLGVTGLVKSHNFGHGVLLVGAICLGIYYLHSRGAGNEERWRARRVGRCARRSHRPWCRRTDARKALTSLRYLREGPSSCRSRLSRLRSSTSIKVTISRCPLRPRRSAHAFPTSVTLPPSTECIVEGYGIATLVHQESGRRLAEESPTSQEGQFGPLLAHPRGQRAVLPA